MLIFTDKRQKGIVLVLVLLLTMAGSKHDAVDSIAKSSRVFSAKLYQILSEKPGNVFFSPTSVEVVLALAQFGARGTTAKQILAGLELPSDAKRVKEGYNAVMTKLKSTDDMVLEIANKVYSEKTFPVEEEFQLVARQSFLAAAENVDFKGGPEECRQAINSWVEKQTRNKINNLLPEGVVSPDTRMVLVNAVYFKGKWKYPFNPQNTKKAPFHITPTETKDVDMMFVKKKFEYADLDDLKAKMLVMPYVGDKMNMVILLPNDIDGLAALEKKLVSVDLANLMKKTMHLDVEVFLPRFKIESTMELNEPLQKLGMVDMFDEQRADFSGISKAEGLFVSKVIQKAFVEVNEEGSEAAAATGMVIAMRMMLLPDTQFFANRPFLYALVYGSTTIFQGRLSDPLEAET